MGGIHLTQPLGEGSTSPDPEAMGSTLPDPKVTSSVSPDLKAMGSTSPDLWGRTPPHLTPRSGAPPRPMKTHTAANHSRS